MESKEGVYLHDRKVVAKNDERGDIDDVFGLVPQMREELSRTRGKQPNHVTGNNIPPRQMVATLVEWDCTLVNEIRHQGRTNEKGQRVK